ncbi:MAG: hypothetical protein WAX69_21625, partial [Victivallales bacterium]
NGLGFLTPDYISPAGIVCPMFNLPNALSNKRDRTDFAKAGFAGYMYNGNPFTWNDFATPTPPPYIGNGSMRGPDKKGPAGYGSYDAGAGKPDRVLLAYDVVTENTNPNWVFHPHPQDRTPRAAGDFPIVDGGNGLFCDGHAKWLPVANWAKMPGSLGGGAYYQPGRNKPWAVGE